ncbi:LodA/GoxA family CTQ-dependent oxidase [Amycolatopsis solani]|uniref:LodA/GoxA family CTQ-dependent oxidase n=1 Tax=Amycolatopsis solani TaxID=3028615 RepID=UPI0025B139B8|nr:LodA/GoxA family CTQ-dependent oxidase [Amycolatopsis sp. MEP2-6]
MAITEVRIHPAIGIARIGNSDTEFFIGPERPWDRTAPPGGYKDAQCRIKRQAARFRVFGYDNGVPVELTAADATIEWTVRLVNRKAKADGFYVAGPRNKTVTGAARDKLVIDPGDRVLTGPDQRAVFDTGTFEVPGHAAVTVPLGEARTDDDGHLLVLGGLGGAGAVPANAGFQNFADNDGWYDDVADGPVTATVEIGGQTFTAAGSWVIVGPPKYAPPIDNVLRLWDAVYDAHVTAGNVTAPGTPSYTDDVYPVLQAAVDSGAVDSTGLGHHAFSHPVAGSAAVYNRLLAPAGAGHMPRLYSTSGQLDLRLTPTQLALMQKWSTGTVTADWNPAWGQGPPPSPGITPGGLDKAALENCVGGAFYPGIEAGVLLTDASLYLPVVENDGVPSFRLDHTKVVPGAVTARMAVPWQSDFYACADHWWPVPRPNQVEVPGQGTRDWTRSVAGRPEFVAGKWAKLGFVTRQGTTLVETDRCDTADTSVNLVTPSITFRDVPQGPLGTTRKAARAVVFEVRSTTPVTLTLTAGPADPSLSRYTPVPVSVPPTGGAFTTVRLWLVYAAPNTAHSVTDSVTASCPETGQTWTIPISANSVPRKTVAAALVLDKSGSMSQDRGDGLGSKAQSLREATTTFLDLMLPGDSLSLTAFDDDAKVVRSLTALGDPDDPFDTSRSDVRSAIYGADFNPGGNTSIGDGILAGRGTLAGAGTQVRSLVVLTDGIENRPEYISAVAPAIDETTYAVGLGTAATTSAAALQTISGNHGGYLLITGSALGGDNQFLLKKYFLQILAGVSNAEVVLDPVGSIAYRQVQRVPFTVSDTDHLVDVILTAEDRKRLVFLVETPDGQLIDPAAARALGGTFVVTDQVSFYRLPMPVLADPARPSHPGTWNAVLAYDRRGVDTHGDQDPRRAQRYSVLVHAWSDLSFTAAAHQSGFEPGATVTLVAGLAEAGIPVTAGMSVQAEITRPGGARTTLALTPGDDEFTGSFVATVPGDYGIRVRATGTAGRGHPFARERTLWAGVWRGGDTPPPGGPGDLGGALAEHDRRWCAVLRCVLLTLAGNDRLMERWRELGLDPKEFLKCVELLCDGSAPARLESVPDDVRRLVGELRRTVGDAG